MEGSEFDEDRAVRPPSPETVAYLRGLAERLLSPEEVKAALQVPLGDEERREILALVDWFCRRYPTPGERLSYARRAYRRWTARAAAAGAGTDTKR